MFFRQYTNRVFEVKDHLPLCLLGLQKTIFLYNEINYLTLIKNEERLRLANIRGGHLQDGE